MLLICPFVNLPLRSAPIVLRSRVLLSFSLSSTKVNETEHLRAQTKEIAKAIRNTKSVKTLNANACLSSLKLSETNI